MSGNTLQIAYNNIFTDNYNDFVRFARGDSDLVHVVYEKLHRRFIERKTEVDNRFTDVLIFSGKTVTAIQEKLYAYIKSAIYNTFLTQQRLKKNTVSTDELQHEIEVILLEKELLNEDNRTYEQQLEYVTLKLFEYIKKYSESEQYVFRVYFLYDKDKRITYKELSKITGYSISKCCGIIQKIKADCKQNLINYINE